MLHAILVESEQIKISLDDDNTILLRRPTLGHMKAIENLPFMVETRFRRVEIFRLPFPDHSAPETDHSLMDIKGGKEDPPSKNIVPTFFLLGRDQAQFPRQFERNFLLLEIPGQSIPTVGGISQSMFLNNLRANPSMR
jgi:hypothetical protein